MRKKHEIPKFVSDCLTISRMVLTVRKIHQVFLDLTKIFSDIHEKKACNTKIRERLFDYLTNGFVSSADSSSILLRFCRKFLFDVRENKA